MRKLRYKRESAKSESEGKKIENGNNIKLIVKCNNAENHKVFIVMRRREGRRKRESCFIHPHTFIVNCNEKCTLNFSIEWKYAFSISLSSSSSSVVFVYWESEWVSGNIITSEWEREKTMSVVLKLN